MLIPRQSSLFVLLGAMFVAALCETLHAQPTSAQITWQVSADSINWSQGIMREAGDMRPLQVRALLTYQPPADQFTRFGLAMCDPTVSGRNGAGSGDTVEAIYFRDNYSMTRNFNQYAASRVNGVLKIDAVGDVAAPGQGSGWVVSSQISPVFGQLTDDLPVTTIFQYTLLLDGTSGIRDLGGAHRQLSAGMPNSFVRVWAPAGGSQWTNYAIPTQVVPGFVFVNVPAPASLSLFTVAGIFAARRRRTRA
jgi:hypothetical protein